MDNQMYTVRWDDSLSDIADRHNTTVEELCRINDIDDPKLIHEGQVLAIAGTAVASSESTTSRVTIKEFGVQSGTDRTIFVTWSWTKKHTDHYRVIWYYGTGDGVNFIGNDGETKDKQSIYTAPENAKLVKVKILPVAAKKTVNDKEVAYWTGKWSDTKKYTFEAPQLEAPGVPTVTIKNYQLTATVTNINLTGAKAIHFQVVRNDKSIFAESEAKIRTQAAAHTFNINPGGQYKVRARAIRGLDDFGKWSDYSENQGTIPRPPEYVVKLEALSSTSVLFDWKNSRYSEDKVTSYEVEWTTNKTYFDSSNEVSSMTVESIVGHAEITGLESGQRYFFRVRSVNEQGTSSWLDGGSIVIGKKPAPPTTWSNTTTATAGEDIILYWVHNSEDNSYQRKAHLELTINGKKQDIHMDTPEKNEEELKPEDIPSFYKISTVNYTEGTKIQWRVKTAGITLDYSDWSIQRTITIYGPATVQATLNGNGSGITIANFPFTLKASAGPVSQKPIGYHVTISSLNDYITVDELGNEKWVKTGDLLFSKYFDGTTNLNFNFEPQHVDLESGQTYKLYCKVSMDSGLTADTFITFNVSWSEFVYEPDVEIAIDNEQLIAYIRPYCLSAPDTLASDTTLAVYRREFDGSFIKIASGLPNKEYHYITDPHPALDYARYRIVARNERTGAISFYDAPGQPIGEKSIVLQWDEEWSAFDAIEGDTLEQPPWSGSMIKLPYNIDISESGNKDISLIEYIGRKSPVSYYGTQLGTNAVWNAEIDREDINTIYALRRLEVWKGDVYVREPSGIGYWASVSVSMSHKHTEVSIPVTLEITRVEGGL